MATNQIKCNKGAVVKEINGVKYFKLVSHYNGDYTKNCGLLASEIDENFYFLRSYDIETAEFNENNELVLTRVDGDKIIAQLPDLPEILFKKMTFEFDKDNGKLIVTYPDGSQEILDGFYVAGQEIKIATDYTLRGDGTICNPLRMSEVERTGTYAPAQYYYDRTDDSAMPTTDKDGNNIGKGFRIVTKEKYEPFGRLYNYDGILAIQDALKHTDWRVPTREDWGDMLNAAEPCPDCREHNNGEINEWKGCVAGARAKSTTSWDIFDDDTKGVDNLPMTGSDGTFHVIPVGYADGSRGARIQDEDHDIEGLRRIASFWSITPTGSKYKSAQPNIFTRTFAYDSAQVLEESSKPNSMLSLRLVKDYNYDCMDFYEYENILGYPVPCVLISDPETNYSKIWTSVNIGFPNVEFSGVTGNEWSGLTGEDREFSERYYINEWNGAEWVKKQMKEGDSVVLIEGIQDESGNSAYNHEWRVYIDDNGDYQLIDTLVALKDEFSQEFTNINERIDNLEERLEQEITDREEADKEIWSAITENGGAIADLTERLEQEIIRATSAETILQDNIDAETERAQEEEAAIWSALTKEIADREAADEILQTEIEEEEAARIEADEALDNKIDEEIERATSAETILQDNIDSESERAQSAETILQDNIDAEAERAKGEEERIEGKLDDEIARAQSAETTLQDEIEDLEGRIEEVDGEGIEGNDYTMSVTATPELQLMRKNGEPINITFDANFGTLPTV